MQLSAVYAMGQTADRRWVPIIIQEMRSPYMEMRLEAARSAGNIGSGDAVDRLIELLHDEELEVQLAAVTALGQIGSDQAYEALAVLMDDEDAYELHEAIEEAMDEIEWLGGDLDLTLMEWDDDEFVDDDEFD
jgi:HEAT repeat protein